MDIERQNFMKEIEKEVQKDKSFISLPKVKVTDKEMDELFCEATKRFNSTLKNLSK